MIHLFLLQYCARCFDKSACCFDTLIDFLKECLCNLGKSLGVSIGILLFIFFTVISSLVLIWVIKIANTKMKQYINPRLKDTSMIQILEKLTETNKLIRNQNCLKVSNNQKKVIVAYVQSLLEIMDSSIRIYCKDDSDSVQRNNVMLSYQKSLLHLQEKQPTIRNTCNLNIDDYINTLSGCLYAMTERKYENDSQKQKEAKEERERIAEKFKQAKEGIEKLIK